MVKNKPLLRSTPIKEKVSAKLILKMLEEAEEKNIMLNSIMIIRDGKVITEGYYNLIQSVLNVLCILQQRVLLQQLLDF